MLTSDGAHGRVRRSRDWRTAVAVFLAVLTAVLAPLAIAGNWTRKTLVEQTGFVATLEPSSANHAIRAHARNTLANQLWKDSLLRKRIQDALPTGIGFISGSFDDQVDSMIEEATSELFDTAAFDLSWRRALRDFQPTVAAFIERKRPIAAGSNGVVSFDLGLDRDVINIIGESLSLPPDLRAAAGTGQVNLFQLRPLSILGNVVSFADRFRWWLAVGAAACLLGSLVFARRHFRALVPIGLMVGLTVVALYAGLFVMGAVHLDSAYRSGIPIDVSRPIWAALTRQLSRTTLIVAAAAAGACIVGLAGDFIGRKLRSEERRPGFFRRHLAARRPKRASRTQSLKARARS